MSHTYKPSSLDDPELREEAARLQRALNDAQPEFTYQIRTAAPVKTWAGMVVLAGTDWNPGSGPGLYKRNAANDGWDFIGPYVTGSGGVVTQATNKATGVTLNKATGEITMNAAALAAGAIVSFTMTNSTIAATDTLNLNHVTTGTRGAYLLNAQCAAGSAVIYVRNTTAGSLSEAIVIRFALIKGATS